MHVLAFAASNSKQSINKQLVEHATRVLQEELVPDAVIEVIDLNEFEMPLFSIDREQATGIPDKAHAFFESIGKADALLISYAEHNGLYTAAFKNLFDWASRIDMKVFQNTPTVAMSTSPGKRGGANVLKTAVESAPHFGAEITASFSVGSFNEVFDTQAGCLTDAELATTLRSSLATLA
jgi:NAD(P)H-dependent FMN reductase